MKKLKAGIAGRETVFREGIVSVCKQTGLFLNPFVVSTISNAMIHLRKKKPDVLLIDYDLLCAYLKPSLADIKRKMPSLKIIVLMETCSPEQLLALEKESIAGIIFKSDLCDKASATITGVMNGETISVSTVLQILTAEELDMDKRKAITLAVVLSPRELDILKLICKEKINKEIAEILFIEVSTVQTHRKNLMDKTNSSSPAGLIIYAYHIGLIPGINNKSDD